MAPGETKSDMAVAKSGEEEAEIDRIIKEIEDLEKKMDTPEAPASASAAAPANEEQLSSEFDAAVAAVSEEQNVEEAPESVESVPEMPIEESTDQILEEAFAEVPKSAKVVPIAEPKRSTRTQATTAPRLRTAPTAVDPQVATPRQSYSTSATHSANGATGAFSLKIGTVTDVSLEFSRPGITVTLSCSDDALVITTDQGAEFRVPFKAVA